MEEEKGTDIGTLLKIISHDLRGPLGNFKNVVALFKTGELQMDQTKMFMEQIEVGIDRSLKLLSDLAEWGYACSEDKKVNQELLDINEVAQDVCDSELSSYDAKGIKLTFHPKKVGKGYIAKSALQVIIKNLLRNSLYFTPANGRVELDVNEDPRHITISISDNGIGIPEKMQECIFDMGKDNRRLGTNEEKGTGIGLFICKDLINKNKGSIWLDHSKEGEGTTFKFSVRKPTSK
ncbi:MAG: HAMP domain-containing histidine kinase [Ekhidna sp.]|nr:HAMP domain-containing histidine kinase [Ekhidna sp.]